MTKSWIIHCLWKYVHNSCLIFSLAFVHGRVGVSIIVVIWLINSPLTLRLMELNTCYRIRNYVKKHDFYPRETKWRRSEFACVSLTTLKMTTFHRIWPQQHIMSLPEDIFHIFDTRMKIKPRKMCWRNLGTEFVMTGRTGTHLCKLDEHKSTLFFVGRTSTVGKQLLS